MAETAKVWINGWPKYVKPSPKEITWQMVHEAAFHGGRLTAQMAEALGSQVVGHNPFNTDALWQQLFRTGYRIGNTGAYMAAISALDIACFDIKGKALGTPIWNLLGGKFRDRIPV